MSEPLDTAVSSDGLTGFSVLTQDESISDEGSWQCHGVAIGEDDVTTGMSGVETEWPSGPLKEAAGMLKGKPLTKNHPGVSKDDSGLQVDSQPPIEDVIGEVTDSKYKDGVGILYEAEVDDEDIAEQIERGRADVSPVVSRSLRQDEETGNNVVESISGFRDLGVVSSGASPSNSIQTGAAAMMAEALSSEFADGKSSDEVVSALASELRESLSDEPADTGTGDDESSTMELTDDEERLVREARNADDPVVVESETEALADEFEQFDDPEIVEKDVYEALGERVSEVRDVLAEALSERTGLSTDTAQSLEFDALMGEFEDEDGNLDAEALVQAPESGQPDVDESDSGMTDDDRERIKTIDAKISALGESLPSERVDALQDEATELAGTDDYDAALEVV